MKYAFMSFSTPGMTLEEILDTAKQYGYDGIEPRLDASHKHGVEVAAGDADRVRIREQAEASGIALACLATSLQYADPAKTDTMLAQTHERIDLAGDVGAPCLRVFGGLIPEGLSREQVIESVADALGQAADHAGERGVTLCFETHDDWCAPVHVAAVLQRVDHPSVMANWDIMHPIRKGGATMDEAFETLKPWIRHLHVHDGGRADPLVMAPIGQGEIDHRRALERLSEMGYTGFISGEWIDWEAYDVHLPRELAMLKQYESAL